MSWFSLHVPGSDAGSDRGLPLAAHDWSLEPIEKSDKSGVRALESPLRALEVPSGPYTAPKGIKGPLRALQVWWESIAGLS